MEERKLFFSPENLSVELCPLLVTKERISNVVHLWFTRLKTEQVRALTVYKSKLEPGAGAASAASGFMGLRQECINSRHDWLHNKTCLSNKIK